MNKEFERRLKNADDAANQFFKSFQETGNLDLLRDDGEIQELYLKAFDVADDASVEEKNFYISYSDFYLYKGIVAIRGEYFKKALAGRKTITPKEFDELSKPWVEILDDAIEQNDRFKSFYQAEKEYKLKEFKEELGKVGVTVQSGGCYVATAVYGSYDCPQVWTLRRYRDDRLSKTRLGRAFISTYYTLSPTLVKWFGNTGWFVRICRSILDKMTANLVIKGYSDSPYSDFK